METPFSSSHWALQGSMAPVSWCWLFITWLLPRKAGSFVPCCPPPVPDHPPMRGRVHTACGKSGWVSHLPPCTVLRKGIQASAAGARSTVTRPERSGDLSRSGCSTVNTLAERRPGGGSGQRSYVCGPGPAWHAASPSETPFAAGLGLWLGKWCSGAALPHQGLGVPVIPPSTCSLSHPWWPTLAPPGCAGG